jgi:hypothetical protein
MSMNVTPAITPPIIVLPVVRNGSPDEMKLDPGNGRRRARLPDISGEVN